MSPRNRNFRKWGTVYEEPCTIDNIHPPLRKNRGCPPASRSVPHVEGIDYKSCSGLSHPYQRWKSLVGVMQLIVSYLSMFASQIQQPWDILLVSPETVRSSFFFEQECLDVWFCRRMWCKAGLGEVHIMEDWVCNAIQLGPCVVVWCVSALTVYAVSLTAHIVVATLVSGCSGL